MPIQRTAEKTNEKDIYKIQYPIKPGESRFDVSYSLPPTETFSSKILHGDGVTRLVTPPAVTLEGEGIRNAGTGAADQGAYLRRRRAALQREDHRPRFVAQRRSSAPAADEDTGEPQIEEKPLASIHEWTGCWAWRSRFLAWEACSSIAGARRKAAP